MWYLLLSVPGPVRLMYIPGTLFVPWNPAAVGDNVVAHEMLFRFGIVADLISVWF
ncbi:MAG TPA: hypothetical protein VG675_07085 [Bryobacteraceae bacterium]|nr:hypothetical protein [Bryobacteraceae bacterium]